MNNDLISRQAAIDALTKEYYYHDADYMTAVSAINALPASPGIIYCKDCALHNKAVGDFEKLPDGKRTWVWKDSACPLVSWRGKAQGHEFDYQFCAYAERRTDG